MILTTASIGAHAGSPHCNLAHVHHRIAIRQVFTRQARLDPRFQPRAMASFFIFSVAAASGVGVRELKRSTAHHDARARSSALDYRASRASRVASVRVVRARECAIDPTRRTFDVIRRRAPTRDSRARTLDDARRRARTR